MPNKIKENEIKITFSNVDGGKKTHKRERRKIVFCVKLRIEERITIPELTPFLSM
jgi:hypothetical protein